MRPPSLVIVRSSGANAMSSWLACSEFGEADVRRVGPRGRDHSEYAGPSSGLCRGFRIRGGGLAPELGPEVGAQGSGGPW